MAAAIARPGVEVIQVFVKTAPSVITPTLVPCVVGVCKQVVDVVEQSSSGSTVLNTDALVTLPATLFATAASGTPPKYTGFNALTLSLVINNGPTVLLTFADPTATGLSPATIVGQINTQFADNNVTAALAETLLNTGTGVVDSFQIRTVGIGPFQTIQVSAGSASVLSTLGLAAQQTFSGLVSYDQYKNLVHQTNFPNPRKNLPQLSIESASVRAFLALGSGAGLRELLRTESFLRKGTTSSAAVLVGTVDLTTLTYATQAVVTGSQDLTAGVFGAGTLTGTTLTMTVNGVTHSLVFANPGNAANFGAFKTAMEAQWAGITVTQASITNFLVITDSLYGTPSAITVSTSTGATALGLALATTTGVAGTLANSTITFATDGATDVVVTFAYPHGVATLLSQINGTSNIALTATEQSITNRLVLTSPTTGAASSVEVVSGTGGTVTALGFTNGETAVGVAPVAAIDDGNGDSLTPLIKLNGADFSVVGNVATRLGTQDITQAGGGAGLYGGGGTLLGTTLTLSDGTEPQTFTMGTYANETALFTALNDFFGAVASPLGGLVFALGGLGSIFLDITSVLKGAEAYIEVVGGTAVTPLGLTVSKVNGVPFPPRAGDQLYVGGAPLGFITQVMPGGVVNVVKIDSQIPINPNLGQNWYMIGKNLTGVESSTRPSADLIVDGYGSVVLKNAILRDTTGSPITAKAPIYLSYKALRKDVSPSYRKALLRFDSTDSLIANLSPITTDNPLGLGLYFALLNAPGISVAGIGVDEESASAPFGTLAGYTRAASFLEAFEVYAIAPLTHDTSIGQMFNAHVSLMSQPSEKGERIVLFNPSEPTTRLDTLVASGPNGNSLSATTFDTGVVNLSALLLAQDIDPTGTIPTSAGLKLNISDNSLNYSISNVSGGVVTVRTSFAIGENTDSYYTTTNLATPPLPASLIEDAFALRVRGASLVNPDGTPDKLGMAETLSAQAQVYLNRRFWQLVPDKAAAAINGLEQEVEGFYLCAATVGMIGAQPPQQSFTNFPMTGFTQIIGSNGFFTESQLNSIAGGGNYIIVQDTDGSPLISRMALTTDMTSIETRTDSVNKVVDFTAKFLRRGLRNFIGRFNVTHGFLDALSHVIHGLLSFLVDDVGVLIGADLNNIIQDQTAPDTVLVDVTLDVPFPCNFLRLTLSI